VSKGAIVGSRFFRICVVGGKGSAAERGYLQDFILKMEMGQSKTAAYETTVAKKPSDLAGCGVCGYIEVLGSSSQKQVANAPSYQIGDKAEIMKPVECAQSIRAKLLP
jgi:hypothetical protein